MFSLDVDMVIKVSVGSTLENHGGLVSVVITLELQHKEPADFYTLALDWKKLCQSTINLPSMQELPFRQWY